jgi:hypothetical protein
MLVSKQDVVVTGQILGADSGALNRALISSMSTPGGAG